MESVGSPEEEVKFNSPVSAPHIIPYSSSSHKFFPQVSNLSTENSKENVLGGREETGETREFIMSEKEGNAVAL